MADREEYRYDVFISYSHADLPWVRGELLPRLEGAGLRVAIDFRNFEIGAPRAQEMHRMTEACQRLLLVLSPDYLWEEWEEARLAMLQRWDTPTMSRRVIPLLRSEDDLPPHISPLTAISFADPTNSALAWQQLLTALAVPPLQAASAPPTPAGWYLPSPYPMPPNFTGRTLEQAQLSQWLNEDAAHPLLVLRAAGGVGKSALAWHWLLHEVDPSRWPRVAWWNFYEGDAPFDSFLAQALAPLGAESTLPGPRRQLSALLRLLHQPGTLLILDGFERALRAFGGMASAHQGESPLSGATPHSFEGGEGRPGEAPHDCMSPVADHFLRSLSQLPGLPSKVLLTSRLRPRALATAGGNLGPGATKLELGALAGSDALQFLHAQGIRGPHEVVEATCAYYGNHPLTLHLLAGLISHDPEQPGEIKAHPLDPDPDLGQRQQHIFEQAHESLVPSSRQLLERMTCFRGAMRQSQLVERVLASSAPPTPPPSTPEVRAGGFFERVFGRRPPQRAEPEATPPPQPLLDWRVSPTLDGDLRDLLGRGLAMYEPRTNRFDLHPSVRHQSYSRLERETSQTLHSELLDHFATLLPAGQAQALSELRPAIELFYHNVSAGRYDEALNLFRARLDEPTAPRFGAHELRIELLLALFPDGEEQPPRLTSQSSQDWVLGALAHSFDLSGQPRRALALLERLVREEGRQKRLKMLGAHLGTLAFDQVRVGALREAEANLRHRIAVFHELEEEYHEPIGHQELGRLLIYRGLWDEAEKQLVLALRSFEDKFDRQMQGIAWAHRALRNLLLARAHSESAPFTAAKALGAAQRALDLAEEESYVSQPFERDNMRAHWLLGAAHRLIGNPSEAEHHLGEALARCRSISAMETEADILLELARLRRHQGNRDEARRLAEEAQLIAERSGYTLQGADVHLFLAEQALASGEREQARQHAQQARQLAACDGPPDYTYKVAYDEAGALLDRLQAEEPA